MIAHRPPNGRLQQAQRAAVKPGLRWLKSRRCLDATRKRIYVTIDELQADLDTWLTAYNEVRTHQGRYCYGKTPMQTFLDAAPTAREKQIGEPTLVTASA